MQPSFCCTQQREVEMICRHCEGEQHAAVPEAAAMQVSPGRVQSLQTPPEQLPMQQSESALHEAPRERHAQRPPTQVIEPQQSPEVEQVAFEAAQAQRPPVQAAPLQHSLADEQLPPARLQQVPMVLAMVVLHEIDAPELDAQQRVVVEQAMPGVAHIEVPPSEPPDDEVQVPLVHVRPVAQSAFDVQPPPAMLRAQCPLRHERPPQHSSSLMHAPDSARQQRSAPCEAAHMVPVAQGGIPPGVQAPPAGVGVVVPFEHVPLTQVRPEQHALIAEHAVPTALQRWQSPPTQLSAALVHGCVPMPEQQRWPSPPHTGVVDASQWCVIVLQLKPGSHAAVPQHA